MKLIFNSDPLDFRQPYDDYQGEVAAVERLGISYALVSHEALVNENNPVNVVRRVPQEAQPILSLYRGWMVTPEQYRKFFEALATKGILLLNDLAAYRHCHYLPESYSTIEGRTPRSVWIETDGEVSIDEIMALLRPFDSVPVVVKDFVKSRKHEWSEACFIPSAADRPSVERVVRRFLELQGDYLNEGLVFREFVQFEPLGTHSKSGMPLTKEFRLFFLDAKPIFWTPYWEEGNYGDQSPPVEQFTDVAKRVQSRFFTMDVAKRLDGDWMIVELGDGQVAGLPENVDVEAFYQALLDNWPATEQK